MVYVDVDPIATALGRDIWPATRGRWQSRRMRCCPSGSCTIRLAARSTFASRWPCCCGLFCTVPDEDQARRVVHAYRDASAPGSYLAVSHATDSFSPERSARTASVFNRATSPVTLRTQEQIEPYFDGYDLVEPGIVPTPSWRPESNEDLFASEPERAQAFAGVGVKL